MRRMSISTTNGGSTAVGSAIVGMMSVPPSDELLPRPALSPLHAVARTNVETASERRSRMVEGAGRGLRGKPRRPGSITAARSIQGHSIGRRAPTSGHESRHRARGSSAEHPRWLRWRPTAHGPRRRASERSRGRRGASPGRECPARVQPLVRRRCDASLWGAGDAAVTARLTRTPASLSGSEARA